MPTLTWLTRDRDVKAAADVPYRLLEAAPGLDGGGEDDRSENLLIQGDNLHALKALLPYYAGRVKCVFIDPPYNTRQDFAHYDDNLEHTQWLEMMYPRLELLRALLAEDGSIWVTVDDSEAHYLKVIMDEIFGRSNFVTNVIWNSTKSVTGTAIISVAHTNMFLYFKKMDYWVKNREEFRLVESGEGFTNPDNDPRGPWKADPFQVGGWRPNQQYEITNPTTGKVYLPKTGNSWKNDYEKFKVLMEDGRIVFGKRGTAGPQRKRFLSEAMERGRVAKTLWDDVETTTSGTRHSQKLFGEKNAFPNPKPEELIQRVLQLATNPGDWVLDSFLGSGTTAAVAHKMGRRWIGIEMGAHAVTHCVPRLNAVIAGEQGGISKAANWSGGGGFGFYRLGDEAFTADGKINPAITFPTLASHVWFSETGTPWSGPWAARGAFLGAHDDTGYALLYNGALGDRRVNGGNVLTRCTLAAIRESAGKFAGKLVIYAAASRFGGDLLKRENIVFKQTPYEIEAR